MMRLTVMWLVLAACATTPPPALQSQSYAAQRDLLARRRMAWRLTRRALRAPDCNAALAYEERVRMAGRESYALFSKALSACFEERERSHNACRTDRDAAFTHAISLDGDEERDTALAGVPVCELGSKVGLHDRAIELALRAARAAAAGACDDALANAREVRTLDATVYEVLAKHRALTECIAKESNPVAQGGPDATSSNPVALGGLDATSSDVVAAEMVVDETTSTDIADETDKTTAVDVARLARCARPIYLEPSVLFGIAGASAPTLLRLTGGARFARCGEYGIGRDVHVGLVFEAPAEFGWRTGAGLELRTSWAVDGNGRVHLGPRVSAVRMPGNRIALWFGARLETGPLSFGMDVVLPIDSLGQVGPTRAASTGVFAVVGLRDKPGTIATGVISLAIPVALLAFWSFLAVAL